MTDLIEKCLKNKYKTGVYLTSFGLLDRSWPVVRFAEIILKMVFNYEYIMHHLCSRGSKGLSNKALRTINNKPLISYTVRQVVNQNF